MIRQLMILQSSDLRIRRFRRANLRTNFYWRMGRAWVHLHVRLGLGITKAQVKRSSSTRFASWRSSTALVAADMCTN
jgi:hypothetical protein